MPVVSYAAVLFALFGLAAAGVLVFHPKLLWSILVLLLPFSVEIPNVLGAGTNLTVPTEALVLLVGIAVFLSVFRTGRLRWTLSPLHVAVGVFLILQWFSLSHSPLQMVTLKALIRTSSYVLCGYVLTQIAVRGQDDLRGFFPLMMASTSGLVVYGFHTQFIEGVSVYQNIAHPFFQNHCIYAAWLCFPLAFAMAALTQRIPNRGWIAMFLGLVGLAVLLSFVRGSWLGIIGLFGYLGYRHRSILNIRFVLALSVLVIAGIAIVFFLGLGHLFQDRWVNLFDRRYVTNDSRIDRWMAALAMWKSYPLFGAGLGCYPDLYPHFVYYLDAYERGIRMGAHSVFFEILAELGVTGFAAYLCVVGCFFRETRRMARLAGKNPQPLALALGLESMMVVYLIHGVVNNLGPSDKIDVAFWTTCGLAVSLRCWLEKEHTERSTRNGF
jgi:O-antigen ligase